MTLHGTTSRSSEIMARARELMPGGVSSPDRAFDMVGGEPFVVERGSGARLWDVDGRDYVDYVLGWGALILGHAPPGVVAALESAMHDGIAFGAPTALEVDLAELIVERMPHIEMLRFVSSHTEAAASAVRVARAFTGRDQVLRFDGAYHGHADVFLVRPSSGATTLGLPSSPGVPAIVAALTLTAPFNDLDAARALAHANGPRLAAICVEPMCSHAGFIVPDPAFLEGLRDLADETGALLIFDEVTTGFRIALGGARERFGITADLTLLGKVIGGGLPVAAYGGRREILSQVAPAGRVFQSGSSAGNPLAMAAGIATLTALTPEVHRRTTLRAARLVDEFSAIAAQRGVPFSGAWAGSMWGFSFRAGGVRSHADAKGADRTLFARFFHAMLERGVYLPPTPFAAAYVSAAHGDAEIEMTLSRVDDALKVATQ
jgi:glutamate-1-semialdehyde 2,1-aminomutase